MKRYKENFKEAKQTNMSEAIVNFKIKTSEILKLLKDKNVKTEDFFNKIENQLEMFGDDYTLDDLQEQDESKNIGKIVNDFLKANEITHITIKSVYEVNDPETYDFTYNASRIKR